MKSAIEMTMNSIVNILSPNEISIYLFGSVCFDDFKLGWSNIDILCLTQYQISDEQAEKLVNLRQNLLKKEPDNKYYRLFEGGILTVNTFQTDKQKEKVVYWGTSGQRITEKYYFDVFSMFELLDSGMLIYGKDIRNGFNKPTYDELVNEVKRHLETIRKYAVSTDESLYSAGWMLDIARGIYTIRTGNVIAKTKAGEWALENELCPEIEVMEKVLCIRNEPMKYKNDKKIKEWLKSLGIHIQRFADVLENELK
ncbi:DUF4111 domain-containing protein [Sedimentibacter sp. zth1]|uniref:aminoglycoside adenylyltransferase domain-containing protein n=1 Tax=Sedimentibacter sp. zth1 TaxID=2816908 RepID=UPI001A91E56E|nr:aminoglycoside adenylyltransferase domain-containing protein [Sedimentibacter sp. zth1]QSX04881.1 DUF4111 domain-containing protein [Sedimentibacter sp. zth1]